MVDSTVSRLQAETALPRDNLKHLVGFPHQDRGTRVTGRLVTTFGLVGQTAPPGDDGEDLEEPISV